VPAFDRREVAAIFVGGMAGALARTGLAEAFPPDPGHWPWVTFAINVAGAFLLGLIAWIPRDDVRRSFAGTGFCSALTTFATVQVEVLGMLDESRYGLAAGYVLGSVAAGLLAVAAGARLIGREPVL
jgi:fluoride exporter